MERLHKVIANSGYTSRRKAEQMILDGKVTVNGELVTTLGYQVKKKDYIEVEGNPIVNENKVYFLLYKPRGVITSVKDQFDRQTVIDLIDIKERIYPIGRLDYNTTGALLLTNDGDFANLIMHPKSHINKSYDVLIEPILDLEHLKAIEKGIILDGKQTLPAKIKVTKKDFATKTTTLTIKIFEGRNRQVRRMFEEFGYKVKKLHRKSIGNITLKGLQTGEYRTLKAKEIEDLKQIALSYNISKGELK